MRSFGLQSNSDRLIAFVGVIEFLNQEIVDTINPDLDLV